MEGESKRRRRPSTEISNIPGSDTRKVRRTSTGNVASATREDNHTLSRASNVQETRNPAIRQRLKKSNRYPYGNYDRTDGFTMERIDTDKRLNYLKKDWFEGKTVLDIGCNSGNLTIELAYYFVCASIIGIDIDKCLIHRAEQNCTWRMYQFLNMRNPEKRSRIPICMPLLFGPLPIIRKDNPPTSIAAATIPTAGSNSANPADKEQLSTAFPYNISFICGNILDKEVFANCESSYDTITCMAVTKWIHLNWGDEGIYNLFSKAYSLLKPGGLFILEPHRWKSYRKSYCLSANTAQVYHSIRMKPEDFALYLKTKIGFSSVEFLEHDDWWKSAEERKKNRPIFLCTK